MFYAFYDFSELSSPGMGFYGNHDKHGEHAFYDVFYGFFQNAAMEEVGVVLQEE